MTQCATDCSTYCSVLPVNTGRAGSAWKKHAEIADLQPLAGKSAARPWSQRLREQALEVGGACRGAGWSGGRCRPSPPRPGAARARRFTPTAPRRGAMPICAFSSRSHGTNASPPPATPTDVRELVELRRHRLVVPRQHGVDHQRVGQAVVQVADGAERVRAGMHRAEVLLERDRAHHRGHHHVGARLQVASARAPPWRARARRCACPRARCRRTAGGRPATGSSRRCASARPCRSPRSPPAAGRASARGRRTPPSRGSAARRSTRLTCVSSSLITLLRPTSLPVPEVVGSATKCGSAASIGRTCGWSQTYSITSPGCVGEQADDLGDVERRAAADADHAVGAVGLVGGGTVHHLRPVGLPNTPP